MNEKKSFFGGLRRGNTSKEISDAALPEEKTEQILPAGQESNLIPSVEENHIKTETTSAHSDENSISDYTRPNETLGNLLTDIRKMDTKTEKTDEISESGTSETSVSLSTSNEPGEKRSTLKDIIAGIYKKEPKNDSALNELKPEDTSDSAGSISEINTTDTEHEINSEFREEDLGEITIGHDTEYSIPERTEEKEA